MSAYAGLIAKYGALLELPTHSRNVTLLEGHTPLIPVPHLMRELGGGFELCWSMPG